jgi:Flp pilus assembly protein CpaB
MAALSVNHSVPWILIAATEPVVAVAGAAVGVDLLTGLSILLPAGATAIAVAVCAVTTVGGTTAVDVNC